LDTAGWFREEYGLKAVLEIFETDWKRELSLADMKKIILESERPLRKYKGEYRQIWK
jgi:hypothetical protein